LELRNKGYIVNHKKVKRLMVLCQEKVPVK